MNSLTVSTLAVFLFATDCTTPIETPGEHEPIGEFVFTKRGEHALHPILSCFFRTEVQAGQDLKEDIKERMSQMGGGAIINLTVAWPPPQTWGPARRVTVAEEDLERKRQPGETFVCLTSS